MRIRKLDIKGFGCFSNRVFEPGKEINLVFGPNEAGKSTLQAFIRAMMYGLRGGRRSRENGPSLLRKYEPWLSESYAGVLEYELNNGKMFRVGRNFLKGSVHIQNEHTEDISGTFKQDKETGPLFAFDHLGLNEHAFDQTLYAGQMKMIPDAEGRKHLLDSLLHLQDSKHADAMYKHAEEALQDAILERVGSERSSTRPLDKIRQHIKELQSELNESKAQYESSRTQAVQLRETDHYLHNLEYELEQCHNNRNTCKKWIEYYEKQEKLNRLAKTKERFKEIEVIENNIFHEKRVLEESLKNRASVGKIQQTESAQFSFLLGRRRELMNVCLQLQDDKVLIEKEYQHLSSEIPEKEIWLKPEYIDDTLQEYLSMREVSGNSDIRIQIAQDTKIQKPRWILPLISMVVGMALFLAIGWMVMNPNESSALITGPSGYSILLLLGLMGSAALASVSMVFCIKYFRHWRIDCRNQSAQSEKSKEIAMQYEQSRKHFDIMLSETGHHNIQDFLQMKRKIDFINRSMTDNQTASKKLTAKIEQIEGELIEIEEHMTTLLEYADLVEEKELVLKDRMTDEKIIQLFQDRLHEYQEDCKEKTNIDKKMVLLNTEKQMIINTIQNLLSDIQNGEEINGSVMPGMNTEVNTSLKTQEEPLFTIDYSDVFADAMMLSTKKSEYEIIQNEIEMLHEKLTSTKTKKASLEVRMEQLPSGERYQQIIEEMDRYKAKETALINYGESLQIALDVLQLSAKKIKEGVYPKLNMSAGGMLDKITSGRYTNIGTNQSMKIQIEVPDTDKMPIVNELSGGTAEQVWLSVRLAAIELLEKDRETLPLFLDEPFAQYDEDRTRSTMRMLNQFAAERQIFLFSCHQRDVILAKEIFKNRLTVLYLS